MLRFKTSLLIVFFVGFFATETFAQDTRAGGNTTSNSKGVPTSSTQLAELNKIFVSPTYYDGGGNLVYGDSIVQGGSCSWKCRKVTESYATRATGYDFASGTTYCEIIDKTDYRKKSKYNANQTNFACANEWRQKDSSPKFVQKGAVVTSKIENSPSDTNITLSRFLSGLVTLDPTIIDRDKTQTTGQLYLKEGITTRGSVDNIFGYEQLVPVGKDNPDEDSGIFKAAGNLVNSIWNGMKTIVGVDKGRLDVGGYEKISVADGFNKANMAYFSNLFENMSKVYQHLQYLLFVVVGGFFLAGIGAKKLQTYLEHKGQESSREPYLHKFYIPLLAVGFFFMPIPEGQNSSATAVQNIIRYFTSQSTHIADIASAEGAKTYVNKLYARTGGIGQEGETVIRIDRNKWEFISESASREYTTRCAERFPQLNEMGIPELDKMTEDEKKDIYEKFDINKVAGTESDIKFETCIWLQGHIAEANNQVKNANNLLKGIKEYYENNSLQKNLENIDSYFKDREFQLGWINSALLPASGIMIELQDYISDIELQDDIETQTKNNQKATQENINKGEVTAGDNVESFTSAIAGYFLGKVAFFIIPGAGKIYEIISNNIEPFVSPLTRFAASAVSIIPGINILSGLVVKFAAAKLTTGIAVPVLSLLGMAAIVESMLDYIPVLVATVAATIATISYLVALCKYFYISPFVVAFALTTKRLDKIIEFLVSGIAIFFKPILLVLFIYLALFLHTLIKEFFLFVSVAQFGVMSVSEQDFFAVLSITGIQSLLKIFGSLASAYVMWKLIISGPSWALKLVGIDGSQDDIVSQSLVTRLEQRSFMA